MIKRLICLLWGHGKWVVLDTTDKPGMHLKTPGFEAKFSAGMSEKTVIRLVQGARITILQCPRCSKLKTIVN